MSAYFKCPICGEHPKHGDGSGQGFGFNPVNGGTRFYHTKVDGAHCEHIRGSKGTYKTELKHFRAEVAPNALRDKRESTKHWVKGRILQMQGHPRKAKKEMALWGELADARM